MKLQTQDFGFKVNHHHVSRSKNDRYNHGDNVDRKLARQERAQFRHLKVEVALRDWKFEE